MEYFYNTIGIVLGILSPLFIFITFKTLINSLMFYFATKEAELKSAKKVIDNFDKIQWFVCHTSQPPNDKMITLHLRGIGNNFKLKTQVSIDKRKY